MKSNKIILSLLVGIIALSSVSLGISIAWYASSRSVYVNSIDITIDSDRELEIATSRDGVYTDHFDYSELTPTTVFAPITTAHSSTWMSTKSDKPLFYDESKYIVTNEETVELKAVTEDYYSQKFYLKSDDDVYVTIDPSKTFFHANEEYNHTYAEQVYHDYQHGTDESKKSLTKEEIEVRLNKIVKAMRFSILVTDHEYYRYGIIDPTKEEETYLGGLLDNNIDRYYDFFHHENDDVLYERVYGEYIGDRNNFVYDEPLASDSDFAMPNEEPSAFNAKHKQGVRTFNLEQTLANGVTIQKENSCSLEDFNKVSKPFRVPVFNNQPQEIVICIYIEGWDLDSINYTMGASFKASLGLKIEREM